MSNFKSTFAITIALILGLPTTVRGQEVLSDLRPLRQLYKQNQLAAQDKYSGNFYEIRGTVSGIYSDDSKVVVDLPGVNVFCYYKQSEYNKVVRLRDKGPVTIKGVLKVDTGWFGNPILTVKNCKIVANHRAQNNYSWQNNSTQIPKTNTNKITNSNSNLPETSFTTTPTPKTVPEVSVIQKQEEISKQIPGWKFIGNANFYECKTPVYTKRSEYGYSEIMMRTRKNCIGDGLVTEKVYLHCASGEIEPFAGVREPIGSSESYLDLVGNTHCNQS